MRTGIKNIEIKSLLLVWTGIVQQFKSIIIFCLKKCRKADPYLCQTWYWLIQQLFQWCIKFLIGCGEGEFIKFLGEEYQVVKRGC